MAHSRDPKGLALNLKQRMSDHNITDYAGTLAYYWFLSIFPGIIFVISVLSFFDIDRQTLESQIRDLAPGGAVNTFTDTIFQAIKEPQGGLLSIGAILAVWSASKGVDRLITTANHAYGDFSPRGFVAARGIALLLTIVLGIGMLLLIVLNVLGGPIITYLANFVLPIDMGQKVLLTVLRYVVSTILLIGILSIFYRVAPKRPITFKEAIPGAVFGVIVWQLLSVGFGFYVSNFSNYNQTYGSLGSVVILLLWPYFTGLIILLGSELNASWERFMKKADPKKMEEKRLKEQAELDAIPTNTFG